MPARPHAIRDSCYFGEEAKPPQLSTTLETSGARDKRHNAFCNLLNNRVLLERVLSWNVYPGANVASYLNSGIPCVARRSRSLYNNREVSRLPSLAGASAGK